MPFLLRRSRDTMSRIAREDERHASQLRLTPPRSHHGRLRPRKGPCPREANKPRAPQGPRGVLLGYRLFPRTQPSESENAPEMDWDRKNCGLTASRFILLTARSTARILTISLRWQSGVPDKDVQVTPQHLEHHLTLRSYG